MKNIITIQHTQAVHHNNGMVGSWTDWELTDTGKEHAENIGIKLSRELKNREWKIYSSDLIRAKQTAEPLARHIGIAIEYRKNLREFNLGEAVGKTKQWAKENANKEYSRQAFDIPEFTGAETWREFWKRVLLVCDDIASDSADNIVIVSHGFTLCVLHQIWLNPDIAESNYSGIPGGVSFLEINDNGERIIKRLYDASYMVKLE